jgi:hypothetical protein
MWQRQRLLRVPTLAPCQAPGGGDVGVNHGADAHLVDAPQEYGHIVDLFIRERQSGLGRLYIGWCDTAHRTCGNLLIGLTKSVRLLLWDAV